MSEERVLKLSKRDYRLEVLDLSIEANNIMPLWPTEDVEAILAHCDSVIEKLTKIRKKAEELHNAEII